MPCTTYVGSSWVVVRLDGRDHTVACWTENISALNGGKASDE